jgi:hypothetical protein
MDDEESVKRAKAKQLLELSDCITKCMEANAKGHGLFLYTHDDVEHMTILTFNAQPDDVYGLVQSANALITNMIKSAMADAPPREKYN